MAAGTMAVPLNGLAMDIALRAPGRAAAASRSASIPAELGRIDVRLDVDKHGNVTSHPRWNGRRRSTCCANDAPRLQQALEDAGLKDRRRRPAVQPARPVLVPAARTTASSGARAQRLVITEDDPRAAAIAGRSYGPHARRERGVEYPGLGDRTCR